MGRLKIAIVGYGKMGRLIEKVALERGHHISAVIDADNTDDFDSEAFMKSDVAIEFSVPGCAVDNILHCFAAKVPVVCGTTGWLNALPPLRDMCLKGAGTMLHSSNFSIGVNIFMALNRYLSRIMSDFKQYHPSLSEVHHIHKKDHPSGTAITLAEELIASNRLIDRWEETESESGTPCDTLPIMHQRTGEVPGIHTVKWSSEADFISITHEAKSRLGFAQGAVAAAEWLAGKRGYFTMEDMLSESAPELYK